MAGLKNEARSLIRKALEPATSARPFYSPIDQAIAEITQGKGTGQQMLAEILKTKGAAKELKDRPAIKKALEQPKVTKQELERVAAEHPAPQVEENVLSGQFFDERHPKLPTDGRLELVENPETFGFEKYPYGVVDKQTGDIIAYGNDKEDAILDAYSGNPKYWGGGTQYAQYTIPHGENYREVLLKIPKGEGDDFKTQHFGGEPNILAHARVSDRTGLNGEKILHVEEVQSDWHQAGRKKGYRSGDSEKAYSDYLEDLKARVKEDIKKTMMQEGVAEEKALFLGERMAERMSQDPRKLANYLDEGDRQMALHQQRIKDRSAIPDAPFKQNWHELVMKRLLDDAARNGYDKVVITPGAEQAKRYDLSKQVEELNYKRNADGTYQLSAQAGGRGNMIGEALSESELEQHVGKDVTQKIINNEGFNRNFGGNGSVSQPENIWKGLSGLDLQVGGEGMKGFYDQILPSFLNDYGKPYGAKVGTYQMPDVETPLHSFDITPQMREDIIGKGLPLYQVAPVGIGAGAAMQEAEPTEYAGGGIIKKAGKFIGNAAQSSGMARPVTATKNLLTTQDFHTSLDDRIRQGVAEKQNLIESMPFKYDKGQRVFTEDSARKNRLPYEILDRTLYGNQPMRADHPVLGPGMGAVIKDPNTGKAMRTPFEAGYRVRSEGPEGWQEYVLPETAIKGDVEMAGGGLMKKTVKGLLPKGQQAVLPAAESTANLERFLADSAVKSRVYHGTMSPDINKFRTPAYFSSKNVANEFADPKYLYGTSKLEEGEHPNVLPVYLNIKKPKVYTTEEEYEKHVMGLTGSPKDLVKQGYDGIIYAEGGKLDDPDAYFVPFEPTQIKSAIGNRGTYDITDPDINMAGGGLLKKAAKALLPKGQQVVLPAAESASNLERFLSKSQVANPVFHVAKTDVKQFSPQHRTELSSMGHHFGTSDQANFRTSQYDFDSQSPNIGKYYLSIQNPLEVPHMASFAPDHLADTMMDLNLLKPEKYDALSEKHDYNSLKIGDDLVKILKKNGYDGLKYPNEREGKGFSYVPFDATQIKSAIGNRGTYDITDPDITKAGGGVVHREEGVEQGIIPKMLSTANRYLPLPTNARVYIDSVIDQRKDPITNKDFSDSEIDIIRDLVHASTKPHQLNKRVTLQPTPGYVNYETYNKPLTSEPTLFGTPFAPDASMTSMFEPKGRVATTLGQFTYGLTPEGHVQVNDTYNFNSFGAKNRPSKGTTYENYGPLDKAAAAIGTMGYLPARAYGQQMLPEGTGRPVNVVIPKERFGESYNDIAEAIRSLQKNTKADGGVVHREEGGPLFQKRAQDLPRLMNAHERHKLEELLHRTRIQGGGGKDQYGTGVGGRITHTIPLDNNMFVSPYIQGNVYKPVGQPAMGGVTGAGINVGMNWKDGGSVSGDAMHMAVMDKQLRNKHGN